MARKPESKTVRDLQQLRAKLSLLIAAQRDAERASGAGTLTFRRKVRRRDAAFKELTALFQTVVIEGMTAAGDAGQDGVA